MLSLGFRLHGLSVHGFSEDEVAKVRAVEAYRRGDFSANAEHPMLMKLSIWGSFAFAERWNRIAPASLALAQETALRLPNAVAGSLTVLAVYGAASLLLNPMTGAVASVLVAFDPTIISINRIGKEDTFFMFFFMTAVFFYERAKRVGETDVRAAQPWYVVAGGSFGLMLASKYLLYFLGLFALYNYAFMFNAHGNKPRKIPYYCAMVGMFLAANFALLLPGTWTYAMGYLRGGYSQHHGYFYDGQLYVNVASAMVWGVPWDYYLRMFWTKLPLPALIGAVAGLPRLLTHRRERGIIWIRALLVLQLIGYAAVAAKFQRYALPQLLVVEILAATGLVAIGGWVMTRQWLPAGRTWVNASIVAALLVVLIAAPMSVAPFFSTYQNAIGAASSPPVTVYPEEAYDYGMREAVADVSKTAGPGAALVSDAALVVGYYLEQTSRKDLESRSLSGQGLRSHGEQWVFVQDSHLYFENADVVAQLRRTSQPWREYRLRGTAVLQVYRLAL